MSLTARCLSLVKGEQRYVFRYHSGQEAEVLASLVAMARDDMCDFDWFDAAVMSSQVGPRCGSIEQRLIA